MTALATASSLAIHNLAATDVTPLVAILQDCHRRPDGTVPPRYEARVLTRMFYDSLGSMCPHRGRVLVGHIGREVAGMVSYSASRFSGMGWDVAYWATAPRFRGAGVGSQILNAALTDIRWKSGSIDDFILVRTAFPAAFERRGFRSLPDDPAMMRVLVRNLRLVECAGAVAA